MAPRDGPPLAPSDTGRNEIQSRALNAGGREAIVEAPAANRPIAFPGQDPGTAIEELPASLRRVDSNCPQTRPRQSRYSGKW